MFFYLQIAYLSAAMLTRYRTEVPLVQSLYFHDNKVKLGYHYQADKYKSMQHYQQVPFLKAIYQ